MRRLLILRHGEASWDARIDAERPLTEVGITQATGAGKMIAECWPPALCIASPFRRTQQTMRGVCSELGQDTWETADWLTPDSAPSRVMSQYPNTKECVLLCSHQPLVSRLLSFICHGDLHSAFAMQPASLAVVEYEFLIPGTANLVHLAHFPDYKLNAKHLR